MGVNKEGNKIVSVKLIFDAGSRGPVTARYETGEIAVKSADSTADGGTIVLSAGNVPILKSYKGAGRKSPRLLTDETVNLGTVRYEQ